MAGVRAGTILSLTVALLAAAAFTSAPRAHDGTIVTHAPGEVLIKFRTDANAHVRAQVRADVGAVSRRRFHSGAEHWLLGPGVSTEEAIARLRHNPHVQYIEPNYIQSVLLAPDDPRYPELWGLRNSGQSGGTPGADINAEEAWNVTVGSRSVVVAVIDSGIDYTHPDLAANIYTNTGEVEGNGVDDDQNGFVDDVRGWDFRNDDNDPMDDLGHGTHVAGTIGAVGNNALGVAGVNWTVSLLPLQFAGSDGYGTTADAIAAINYATLMGADIINSSWGGVPYSQALLEAITEASNADILFVAAAGNNSLNTDVSPFYPSGYDVPNVVAVAATDRNDALAFFSNYGGSTVDLAAPGVSVLSTVPAGGFDWKSGTSMAAPHVAGAAALIRALAPQIGVVALKQRLLDSVDVLPRLAGRTVSGGRLNAFRAISDRETIPPGACTDLNAGSRKSFSLTLTWTATGDDLDTGTAAAYDVRYSTSPFDEAGFASALQVTGVPAPLAAGTPESFEVRGLEFSTTYYFALKAIDEWGNAGPMSNLASGTTLGPPDVGVFPDSLSANVFSGKVTTRTLNIENHGVGDLTWRLSIRPHSTAVTGGLPAGTSRALGSSPTETSPGGPASSEGPAYSDGSAPSGGPLDLGDIRIVNTFATRLNLLLLESGGVDLGGIHNALLRFPDIATIDVLYARDAPPTLADLQPYDAVIVAASAPWADPVATGNALADYADTGGGVVLTLASFLGNWSVRGRFETQGYHPLLGISGPIGWSILARFDATHPIMKGVTSAWADGLAAADLMPGAVWVADWAFGQPFIATQGENVVAVNFFAGTGYWDWFTDIPLILHNAAFWSSKVRWLSVDPTSGTLPPGASLDVVVTFDAARLTGGDYDADLAVSSNDPDEPEVVVPTHLHVTGVPDISVGGETVTLESSQDYTDDETTTLHTLTATVAPSGGGALELTAYGDYDQIHETATVVAEGLTLGTVGWTRSECGAAQGSFDIGAVDLAALAADGVIHLEVRNSAYVNLICLFNRHTVRLSYAGSLDVLDFGPLFRGASRSLTFEISNDGTDVLTGSLEIDHGDFSADTSSLSLAVGESRNVVVTFRPTVTGLAQGTLTIHSNDPDEGTVTVSLSGTGLMPPDIAVSPGRLDEVLLPGEIATRTVTIANTGLSDLPFEIKVRRAAPPAGAAGASPESYRPAAVPPEAVEGEPPRSASNTAPEDYIPTETPAALTPGATVLIIESVRPWNTTANEQVLSANGIAYDLIGPAQLAATDLSAYPLVIVPGDQTTSFYSTLAGRAAQLEAYVRSGGVLEFHAAGWGYFHGNASLVTLPGGMGIHPYLSTLNRVLAPGHPLMIGVPDRFQHNGGGGEDVSHSYFSSIPANAIEIANDGTGRTNLVEYRLGAGTVIAAGQTFEYEYGNNYPNANRIILSNMIPYAHGLGPPWIHVEPLSGVVPAGASLDVVVTFDAAGLTGGDYDADLVVSSSDPDEPEVVVPAYLHVTGVPDISVSGETVTLESSQDYAVYGATTLHTLTDAVAPDGGGALELIADGNYNDSYTTATVVAEGRTLGTFGATSFSCMAVRGSFAVSAADLTALAADGVIHLEVRNSSAVPVYCDVNRHTVRLSYAGAPGLLDFGPLFAGTSRRLTFEISNDGTDVLTGSLEIDHGNFGADTSSLSLAAGESRNVVVTFWPTVPGLMQGTLTIHSNDPDEGTVTVSLSGTSLMAPDIAVSPGRLDEALFPGEIATRTVTIANTGLADLPFEIKVRRAAKPATVLIIQSVRPWGTSANEQVLSANGIAYDLIAPWQLVANDLSAYRLVIVPGDQTTSFYSTLAGRAAQLEAYVRSGGVLEFHAAGWGWSSGDASLVTLPGGMGINYYVSSSNRVLASGHPLMTGVPDLFSWGGGVSLSYFTSIPANAIQIAHDGTGRTNLVEYRLGAGRVIAGGQSFEYGYRFGAPTGTILRNMIPYAGLGPAWIHVDPLSGVVPAGASLEAAVTFDARGDFAGDYDTDLVVSSNDPDEPEVVVPVHLHVNGIAVTPASLVVDLPVGQSTTRTLAIHNTGDRDLIFFIGPQTLPTLSIVPSLGQVAPGGRADVTITFDARFVDVGIYQSFVNIRSNDPARSTAVPVTVRVVLDSDLDGILDPADNCPTVPNPLQEDGEGDGVGDACDNCPALANSDQADADSDDIGDACDNCLYRPNPAQENADADALGDACDNCASVSNPDQADVNEDGSGDACQPSLILHAIVQDVGVLKVRAEAHDPQGDALRGRVEFLGEQGVALAESLDCTGGYLPHGVPGEGIGFLFGAVGQPFLFDLNSVFLCGGASADYILAAGSCDQPIGAFVAVLPLDGLVLPAEICVRRFDESGATLSLTLVAYGPESATLRAPAGSLLSVDFDSGLPREAHLDGLETGSTYRLAITVTDGSTVPVRAGAAFLYQSERLLLINNPPRAVAAAPGIAECDRPGGASLALDGRASEDPDSRPGSQDDLVGFDWFRDLGLPTEQLLGTGPVLPLILPLGTHNIGLRVTDMMGESATSAMSVTVRDTAPPDVVCPGPLIIECTGPEGGYATLISTVSDACDPAPRMGNDRTPNGGDGSGLYPLGSTPVGFMAEDASGNAATCDTVVTVADTTPPALAVVAEPAMLWPPNHTLRPIRIGWQADDRCDPHPTVVLLSATSSEPDDAAGDVDGETPNDISGADPLTPDTEMLFRAERSGTGSGRTYNLVYQVLDSSGNAGATTAVVQVPHDIGGPVEPMMLRLEQESTAGQASIVWSPVPGAQSYDVIVGELSAARVVGDHLSLGSVRILARGTDKTHAQEGPDLLVPAPGRALIYLAQPRDESGGAGYGTESAPWPRIPDSCGEPCP